MTRTMYDSVSPTSIPASAGMVAGYVSPSGFAWSTTAWARFPNAVCVRITPQVSHAGVGIHVLDVENGDATPAQAPSWVKTQRALGQDPTVYCSMSSWQAVQTAFNVAGVAQPHYWVAGYPGGGAVLPTLNGIPAVAHQYADPNSSGGDYDLSVVADYWPGVDDLVAVLQSDDYTNIATAVWNANLVKAAQTATAQVWLVNANTNVTNDEDPQLAAILAAVKAQPAATVTLSADQLTAFEASVASAVQTAVSGLNLSVSPTDQAAIAAAVAAELGTKLTA